MTAGAPEQPDDDAFWAWMDAYVDEPHNASYEVPDMQRAYEAGQAASELAALRELLDEIGVMAANAPEDGDSFGLLEEIAMRVAAAGVPDSPPPGAAAAPGLLAEILGSFVSFGRHGQFRRCVLGDDEYQSWCRRAEVPDA